MKAYRPSEVVVNNTLFIDKTENAVGINTMTPRYNLDVVGKINCSDDLSVGGSITGIGNLTATGSITASGNLTASGLISATGNITSSGNVGIGVTSPTNRLSVRSNVTLATNLSGVKTSAQLAVSGASGNLYIGNTYSGGSIIQSTDTDATAATTLFLNPLGGNVSFGSGSVNLGSDVVTFSIERWHKSSDGKNRLYFANNSTTYYGTADKHVFRSPTDFDLVTINSSGNVGIGTATPAERLHVSGNITASGNVTAFSDARVKTNIVEIDSPLEKIKNMRGVYYNRIDDSNTSPARHVGVIAQEVERVLPEVVLTDTSEEKHKSVAYGNIVALLIEGMKAQQSTIESLLDKLAA